MTTDPRSLVPQPPERRETGTNEELEQVQREGGGPVRSDDPGSRETGTNDELRDVEGGR